MSNFGTITGKSQFIGFGTPQPFPITLDPAIHEGAVVYADNDQLYYSDGAQWLVVGSGVGGTTTNAILPFAFVRIDGTSPTGTNISGSNWNAGAGTMDLAFTSAQPDTDYTVVTDGEFQDDGRYVSVQNKTVNGFEVSLYDGNGAVVSPSSINAFAIMVFASDPVVAVGAGIQGTTGAQGEQGLQGEYGPGFTIIGSVAGPATDSSLQTAFPSANIGEGVIDQSDDTLWIWDGTTWINIGSFRGVQGLQGDQGTQGVQGTLGYEGIQGERGFRGHQGFQGMQGTQGIQGDLGFQGTQGVQGVQGTQGFTGIQGDLGFQGTQGLQGDQGTQGFTGIQGDEGLQGYAGEYGGVTFEFDFDLSTIAQDPGAGEFAINNADPALASAMFIDNVAKQSKDITQLLTAMDTVVGPVKGYIQITRVSDIAESMTFQVTNLTNNTGWWLVDITAVQNTAGVLTGIAADPAMIISFVQAGAQGVQGTQGFTGIQGAQGLQGDQGTQGMQGDQGTTGFQGIQGDQGTQGLQGDQGTQGLQGDQGTQGTQGSVGDFGGITYDYDYSNNTTDADPGQGNIRLSNVNFTTTPLKLWVDDLDDGGINVMDGVATELNAIVGDPKGYVKIINTSDIYDSVLFRIDSFTDRTGYWELDVVRINGSTGFTDGDDIRLTFSRNGDRGIQGPQGTQGIQGDQGTQGLQGDQGTQGIQGDQGVQGFQGLQGEAIQGSQGTQGDQGTQGIQGDQGVQGTQGFTGLTGNQGAQGLQGLQGLQGEQGEYGGLTFVWNYSSNIVGGTDPGANNFKFNNSNPSLATLITLDDIPADQYTTEIDPLLDWIDSFPGSPKGYLKIQVGAGGDPGPGGHHWLVYEITDWTWDSGSKNYGYFDVNYVDGNASSWTTVTASHGVETLITFVPRGPQGIQGAQGTQGFQGFQGLIGQGTQGPQGTQGIQGDEGEAGSFGGITFDYTFSTDTINNNPGPGYLKFNNSTYSSVTSMYINDRDDNFVNIEPFLRTIDDSTSPIKGHFRITKKGSPEIFQIFTISALVETTGYYIVSAAFVSGNGTFANDEDVTITFARTGDVGSTGAQGFQGAQGVQGTQGDQGLQGATGQGLQGIQGPQGTQGFQGDEGDQGPDGPQGTQGIQGTQGFQGELGFQGPGGTGADGAQGIQGVQGTQGIIGADGDDGAQGPAGAGSQGIQGDQGVQGGTGGEGQPGGPGPQGTQGIQGDQGVQGEQGIGAQGTTGEGIQGPQGTQGLQGQPGEPGAQGAEGQGTQGTQGLQGAGGGPGIQGLQGIQGDQGIQGNDGAVGETGQGIQGVQGFQGDQGTQGLTGTGSQGAQGIQGNQGFDGPAGEGTQGAQGLQGFQGIQGDQGVQGNVGATSAQGNQGIQGDQGIQGPFGTGADGSQGPQGTQGIQGGPGETGADSTVQGPQGIQGDQGLQGGVGSGDEGAQGIQGIQGDQGPAGTGAQGTPGDEGVQGEQGIQGPQGTAGGDGGDGVQGEAGPQGEAGQDGTGTEGPEGPEGPQGVQGPQGGPGIQGAGGTGPQGIQGTTGDIGDPGIQGSLGTQGTQGTQGLIGNDSTVAGPQGVQGTQGFLGPQGTSGSTDEVEVDDLNISGLQTTNMFITLVQGGSGARQLYGTTGPNYSHGTNPLQDGLEKNLYYHGQSDTLHLENINVGGTITIGGTSHTTIGTGSGSFDGTATNTVTTGNITFNDNAQLKIGTSGAEGNLSSDGTDIILSAASAADFLVKDGSTTRFTMDISTGDFTATGNVTTNSDSRLKENVNIITNALDIVDNLRGVRYNKIDNDRKEIGLIAQEVEEILPEVVVDGDYKSISYGNITAVLIEAIKELKAEIEELKK